MEYEVLDPRDSDRDLEVLLSEIRQVGAEGWRGYDFFSEELVEAFIEKYYTVDAIRNRVESDSTDFFVAENDRVAGIGQVLYDFEPPDLFGFYVLEGYRDRGVGADILEKAEESIQERGHGKVATYAFKENESGKNFFLSHGYEIEEEEKALFLEGTEHEYEVEEVLLVKELRPE